MAWSDEGEIRQQRQGRREVICARADVRQREARGTQDRRVGMLMVSIGLGLTGRKVAQLMQHRALLREQHEHREQESGEELAHGGGLGTAPMCLRRRAIVAA